MAQKRIVRVQTLHFPGGEVKPGPHLAGLGINMPSFTREFNAATQNRQGTTVPTVVTVYHDKSYSFITKTSPAAELLLKAANIEKGSPNSKTTIVATISNQKLVEIAKHKLPDLNTANLEAATNQIAGTAKNMGILVEGRDDIEKLKKEAKEAQVAAKIAAAKEQELAAATQQAADAAKESVSSDQAATVDEEKAQGTSSQGVGTQGATKDSK